MAEPLTLLGAAAGGVQFLDVSARAFMATLRLAKDLRGAPERVSKVLDDAERSTKRIILFLSDLSRLSRHLTTEQFSRLSSTAMDYRRAMDDMTALLKPLVSDREPHKRIWRSFISVRMDNEIVRMLDRIQSLNGEVVREADLVGLEMTAALMDTTARVEKSVEATTIEIRAARTESQSMAVMMANIEATAPGLRTDVANIQITTAGLGSDLGGVRTDVTGLRTPVDNTSRQTGQVLESVFTLGVAEQARHEASLSYLRRLESIHQEYSELHRHQLSSIRDEILTAVAAAGANQSSMESLRQSGDAWLRLTDDERAIVGHQTGQQLVRSPGALRSACDTLRARRPTRRSCRCRPWTRQTSSTQGVFKFRNETQADHEPDCPLHRFHPRSWKYSVSVWLRPFLNQTVEFTLGATFGAGAWSLSSPLRFRPTVKSSESPLFRLLSELEMELRGFERGEWIEQRVAQSLVTVRQYFDTGVACALDINERDQSALHDCFAFFAGLRGGRVLERNIFALIDLVLAYGGDPSQLDFKKRTPLSLFLVLDDEQWRNSIPLYGTITEYQLWDTVKPRDFPWDSVNTRDISSWPQKYPELMLHFECEMSHISWAIMRRNIVAVKKLRTLDDLAKEALPQDPDPVLLAFGWAEGLAHLVELGCDVEQGLEKACKQADTESLRIILHSPGPLFANGKFSSTLNQAFEADSLEVLRLVISELASRRRRLANMAIGVISPHDSHRLALNSDRLLVSNARQVFNTLTQDYHVQVPEALDCFPKASTYEGLSDWHTLRDFLRDIKLSAHNYRDVTERLDIILQAGFDDFDVTDERGRSVLYLWCQSPLIAPAVSGDADRAVHMLGLLAWELNRGANEEFPPSLVAQRRSYPSALFYIASCLNPFSLWAFTALIRTLRLKPFDGLVNDGCVCYCSSNGCLPPFMFLRCPPLRYFWMDHPCELLAQGSPDLRISQWCICLGLRGLKRELVYYEACRLEIFERLGMAHTCCAGGPIRRGGALKRVCVRKAERDRMRQEDAEAADHLNTIMGIYHDARLATSRYRLHSHSCQGRMRCFWYFWWGAVAQILPPRSFLERCRYRGLRDWELRLPDADELLRRKDQEVAEARAEQERAALVASGYEGMEFGDVARRHLGVFQEVIGLILGAQWIILTTFARTRRRVVRHFRYGMVSRRQTRPARLYGRWKAFMPTTYRDWVKLIGR